MKSSNEIRKNFLEFFERRGHAVVPSSPLIPAGDSTLLFVNAGMVQFKDVFLGNERRDYTRATSSQCCIRAGGKHNDLENVGYTARHHTFFEMLGNFSFGDYFKREAIAYAWEFVTQTAGLPVDRLWVTVFEEDDESEKIWLNDTDVHPGRIRRAGARDNFWSVGDTGPCGPCTEIFYDHGKKLEGAPPASGGTEGDRYVEIWNLVFMQYQRDRDGKMTPLPRPSVDTGMGLERMAAVMQGVCSNYDTDLFRPLIGKAAEIIDCKDFDSPSLKVIADHIRACSFLIADGVRPENEGRGYVLRRIIRRAVRHGHRLGAHESFFHRLVEPLQRVMGDTYPQLKNSRIKTVLKKEEERFRETLDTGLRILEGELKDVTDGTIPGKLIFKLYDTYGFPVDLTADIARERKLQVDLEGFAVHMERQKRLARDSHRFSAQDDRKLPLQEGGRFSGYTSTGRAAAIRQILVDGESVKFAEAGAEAMVVLDDTPFYGESGGQIGDTGILWNRLGSFRVNDTQKQEEIHVHVGQVEQGKLAVGDRVDAQIDVARRLRIVRNHSATHLLHAALKQVLGDHVQQRGSLVADERLRFDFLHDAPMSDEELRAVENLVNEQICDNVEVVAQRMDRGAAAKRGAVALFGEKYGDEVRVLSMGDFSIELCGGTHVQRTGDIGVFKVVSETGIAAGVRRIEALTGDVAYARMRDAADCMNRLQAYLQTDGEEGIDDRIRQLVKENKRLARQAKQAGSLRNDQGVQNLEAQVREVSGIRVLAAQLAGGDSGSLRTVLDSLREKLGPAVIVLATTQGERVRLIAGVGKTLTGQINASELVRFVAEQIGGRGGGKADMAEAGGGDPAMLDAALGKVPEWVSSQMEQGRHG